MCLMFPLLSFNPTPLSLIIIITMPLNATTMSQLFSRASSSNNVIHEAHFSFSTHSSCLRGDILLIVSISCLIFRTQNQAENLFFLSFCAFVGVINSEFKWSKEIRNLMELFLFFFLLQRLFFGG